MLAALSLLSSFVIKNIWLVSFSRVSLLQREIFCTSMRRLVFEVNYWTMMPVESRVRPILTDLSRRSAQMTCVKNSAAVRTRLYFCQKKLLNSPSSSRVTRSCKPKALMLTLKVSSPSCCPPITSTLAPLRAAKITAKRQDSLHTTPTSASTRPKIHCSSWGYMLPFTRRTSLQQEAISSLRQSCESASSYYCDSKRPD